MYTNFHKSIKLDTLKKYHMEYESMFRRISRINCCIQYEQNEYDFKS